MQKSFKAILKGKVVIIGIGNIMRGDDGLGPVLIEKLKGKVKAACIDSATAPENYTGKIAKENPDTILIVDAVHLELNPGEYNIIEKSEIEASGLTTHDISPKMFIDFLDSQTSADIYMLGIQPKNISFGDEISDEVKKGIDKIAELITEVLKNA